jgi:hypothetical protein
MDKEQFDKLIDVIEKLAKAFVMMADAERMRSYPLYVGYPAPAFNPNYTIPQMTPIYTTSYPQTTMGGGAYNIQSNDDGTFRQVKDFE